MSKTFTRQQQAQFQAFVSTLSPILGDEGLDEQTKMLAAAVISGSMQMVADQAANVLVNARQYRQNLDKKPIYEQLDVSIERMEEGLKNLGVSESTSSKVLTAAKVVMNDLSNGNGINQGI